MAAQPQPYLSFDEYLARERQAEYRSEYVNGQVVAMAGASPEHEQIVMNIGAVLTPQLWTSQCKSYGSNLRVWIPLKNRARYPGAAIICGKVEYYLGEVLDTVLNPQIIFEILSPSTEALDRGVKAEEYRSILTLQEYLFIAQDRCHVEHYVRQSNNQWLLTEYDDLQNAVYLPSINCKLESVGLYRQLEWAEAG